MASVDLYNLEGKKNGKLEVADKVFAAKLNPDLVHQVYVALEANARQPWADTKDKSEVRGGGKKPWKQKGTGRARHGSSRSPIWKGGGVTFGPLSIRNYKKKVNKKMNRQAVSMCLSDKLMQEKMFVLEQLVSNGKTKEMVKMRSSFPGAGKSTLVITSQADDNVFLSTRNIQNLHLQSAQDLNVVDLLHHQYVIATQDALKVLEKRLS
ncbi:MAG: 50S ribosomal protein L4 [Candidatus Magasanikbacteria bacterium CG11_big_fil_rev_8_21_14_0_20_39_34]|uniref:Large ribosomal subunit protein uL4 n=1 Tax=Candidatus Magasanikbacteria bacterium CG11_big_fil_rev_8_21_14_0_20_39_34 TaxID=1974653 RepID=A0A2H0N3S6_9BACT|nr:MAG: 50S ribosomal protein L4 [Candidatus Magasanikbacteria bacterium CG11_big_fil_rev_8_21_14_0_20_39_34]